MIAPANIGGNALSQRTITIRRNAAIGDVIASTIVADKLLEKGFGVAYQCHGSIHSVLRRHPGISPISQCGGFVDVNLDGAYERHPDKRRRHFYGIFTETARFQLNRVGISLGPAINCRPRLQKDARGMEAQRANLLKWPRPWIFVCPRSESYKPRQVPDAVWVEFAREMDGTCFWLGLSPGPAKFVDLKVRHLPVLMDLIASADLVISVDTGPMHIANAFGIPVLAIGQSSSPELHLSDQTDFRTIEVEGLDCLNCMENICPLSLWRPYCQDIPFQFIAREAKRSLAAQSERISCVIPIYRPREEMLMRCLEAVLPQVDEVVLTMERGGIVPCGVLERYAIQEIKLLQMREGEAVRESAGLPGLPQQSGTPVPSSNGKGQAHRPVLSMPPEVGKVFAVRKPLDNIGFGRNVNFGFRHSTGRYVLVLNDDVYLDPTAVQRMMDCMKPRTGVVGMFTRYPDGRIYHAGKVRKPDGSIGFPHLDLYKYHGSIKEPMEMENTNGAAVLFRREAFYDIDGFDEGYMFYAEDDDICMRLRKAGWQVWYTPLATGVHDEHQESKLRPSIRAYMAQSNARFGHRWADYFKHNRGTAGLGNFHYLR